MRHKLSTRPGADSRSPLRYPGGKALLSAYVGGVLEENFLCGCTFYEPYAGGASVSLDLLRLGFVDRAVLVERDPLIYAFWQSVFNNSDALCSAVEGCAVTLEFWRSLLPLRELDAPTGAHSILQLGLAGLFFNRTNFSGIVGAGPIGGQSQSSAYKIDCRFNKANLIRQIQSAGAFGRRVAVHFGDAVTFLRKNAAEISGGFSFVYADPPYYAQGRKLYRHHYSDVDHQNLSSYITSQGFPWLVSYDDHPRIRELYSTAKLQPIYLDYKVKTSRTAQELLISNLVIPPPVYGDPERRGTSAQTATEPVLSSSRSALA